MAKPGAWNMTVVRWVSMNGSPRYPDAIELACRRIRHGQPEASKSWLLMPRNRPDPEWLRATGLYARDLEAAPAFKEIVPELLAWLGKDILVFETLADREAFRRMIRPHALTNRLLDGESLAARLGADAETTPGILRAGPLADVLAERLLRLMQAVPTAEQTALLTELMKKRPETISVRRRTPVTAFDCNRLKTMSTMPGVYFMKNEAGEVLYIGKAKNLRNRLRSYFQNPRRLPRKVLEMVRQVADIETREVGSELEALLLEARLIKQQQPWFNRLIKHYKHMVFMRVTMGEPFPRVEAAREMSDPDSLYFGPFQSENALAYKTEILNKVFGLRACDDKTFARHRDHPCMEFDLGRCSAPCAGRIPPEDYRVRVRDFIAFLRQEPSAHIQALKARRDHYAEELAFEKAAAIQQRLDILETLQLTSYRFLHAVQSHHAIIILPDGRPGAWRILSVLQGQPLAWQTFHPDHDSEDMLAFVVNALFEPYEALQDKEVGSAVSKLYYEEARLISQWLAGPDSLQHGVIPLNGKSRFEVLAELRQYVYGETPWELLPVYEDEDDVANGYDTYEEQLTTMDCAQGGGGPA